MRFHLATAILLSVLAGSNAQQLQQEPERKPRPILSTAFEGNNFLSRSHKTNTYYKRKKSESPSYMPSSDPSSSPSDVPSASPSDAPSDVPSTVPSDEPSTSPSSAPSDVPSTVPSSSPSATPSTSPSDEPSTVPSSSPSDESDRVLYIGDPMTCSTKITVGEVEETLGAFLIAMDKMAIMENLKDYSPKLQMMSLGLSKSIESESSDFGTRQLVAEKIEATLFPLLDALNREARENFNALSDKFSRQDKAAAVYIMELMEEMRILKDDFKSFISSRGKPDEHIRLHHTQKFRRTCNAVHSMPIDMFRHVYEYGCGVRETPVACGRDDFGECFFEPKSPLHIVGLPVTSMGLVFGWISATLAELSLLNAVCLPAMEDTCNADTCVDPNILSMDDTSMIFRNAAEEVFANVVARSNCEDGAESGLEICRINSRGYFVSPRDVQYDDALPINVSEELNTKITDDSRAILKKFADYATFASEAATAASSLTAEGSAAFKSLLGISSAFGGIGMALSFAVMFIPTPNPTLDAVREGFKEVDAKLDILSDQLKLGIDDVINNDNDNQLDDLYSDLQKIRSSYSKYMTLADEEVKANPAYQSLVEQYTEEFRFACNELDSKPEDIIRDLYGYACGDANFADRCHNIASGAGIGQCGLGIGYGKKKNNYILDKKFNSATTVSEYRKFSAFMKGALVEALFLQQVCLPPIVNTCVAETDSIREQALQNSINAIAEVEGNLDELEQCFCPCGVVEFKTLSLADDKGISDRADLTKLEFEIRVNRRGLTKSPGQDKDRISGVALQTYYTANVIDEARFTSNGDEIQWDGDLQLKEEGREFLSIDMNNAFKRSNSPITVGFPIESIDRVEILAIDDDYDFWTTVPDDKYQESIPGTTITSSQVDFYKCKPNDRATITIDMTEDQDSDMKGRFRFDVIKKKESECNRFSSGDAFCSKALPDCPNTDDYYCDFEFKRCREKLPEGLECNANAPCKNELKCLADTAGVSKCRYTSESENVAACEADDECGSNEFCDYDEDGYYGNSIKVCQTKLFFGRLCTRSAMCGYSGYCGENGRCQQPAIKGQPCSDSVPCSSEGGLKCVDDVCKDDLNKPCARNDDCASTPDLYCNGIECKQLKNIGSGCTAGNQCKSGFCDPIDRTCKNN